MKNLSSILFKGLLSIVLFTGVAIALSAAGFNTVQEASAEVTQAEVIRYLESKGYTVHALKEIEGSQNWKAYTTRGNTSYMTTVFVSEGQIIGNEDVSL